MPGPVSAAMVIVSLSAIKHIINLFYSLFAYIVNQKHGHQD